MIIELPNGEMAEFPDTMSEAEALNIVRQKFPPQQPLLEGYQALIRGEQGPLPMGPPATVLQSIPRGFRQGVAKGIAKLGAGAGRLGPAANEAGVPVEALEQPTPSYEEIRSNLFGAMKGSDPDTSPSGKSPWYAPWKIARTVGEMAGLAPLGVTGAAARSLGTSGKLAGAVEGATYGGTGEHPAVEVPVMAALGGIPSALFGGAKKVLGKAKELRDRFPRRVPYETGTPMAEGTSLDIPPRLRPTPVTSLPIEEPMVPGLDPDVAKAGDDLLRRLTGAGEEAAAPVKPPLKIPEVPQPSRFAPNPQGERLQELKRQAGRVTWGDRMAEETGRVGYAPPSAAQTPGLIPRERWGTEAAKMRRQFEKSFDPWRKGLEDIEQIKTMLGAQ